MSGRCRDSGVAVPEFISLIRWVRDDLYPDLVAMLDEIRLLLTGSAGPNGPQLLGVSPIKAVQYMAQTTTEELIIPEFTNAFAIDSLVLEDGASITIRDGGVFKIL